MVFREHYQRQIHGPLLPSFFRQYLSIGVNDAFGEGFFWLVGIYLNYHFRHKVLVVFPMQFREHCQRRIHGPPHPLLSQQHLSFGVYDAFGEGFFWGIYLNYHFSHKVLVVFHMVFREHYQRQIHGPLLPSFFRGCLYCCDACSIKQDHLKPSWQSL